MEKKDEGKPGCLENMTPFVLLIGLGVHAVFEGIAMGTETDSGKAAIFALAIFLHKGAAGMSLGISLAKTFPHRDLFVVSLLVFFSTFTPLGIIIGMLLKSGDELIEIIFSCLAAGTFIYIAGSEIIVEEFAMPDGKCIKFLFYILGIVIVSSLLFIDA